MIRNIIVLGASITASPWLTWKDFLEIESRLKATDLSTRGVGNEYMVTALAQQATKITNETLVVAMFTNVDKFDWYVEGNTYHQLQKQKHQPIQISNNSGFWCTGSWFPDLKELYHNNFYSLDYFTTKSIQQIVLLTQMCQQAGAQLEIFFDSPIWNYTEQDVNAIGKDNVGPQLLTKNLLDQPLTKFWATQLGQQHQDLENQSLIGHCWTNGLDWYTIKYKGHPPSGSHWSYYNTVMKPRLSTHITMDTILNIESKIQNLDLAWKTT